MITPNYNLANYLLDKTYHNYRALADISTKHLVVFSVFNSTLLALQDNNFDYILINNIAQMLQVAEHKANHAQINPKDVSINFAVPWVYKLNGSHWEKTSIDTLPQDIVDKYYLTQKKAVVLDNLHAEINCALKNETSDIYLQDIIYSIKYKQAKDVLSEVVDPIKEPRYYGMVANYAELRELTLVEAANEIIVQHKLYIDLLTTIEYFRLKFIKQIKDAKSLDELVLINNNLTKERIWYYQG